MQKHTKRIIVLLLISVFIVSGALVLRQISSRFTAENTYRKAQQIANLESPPTTSGPDAPSRKESQTDKSSMDENLQFLLETDLSALRQICEDVVGWIYIPDTPISYPLLQAEDNEEYLNKTWDGSRNRAGSIYLECKNEPDFQDFNTLVYGHRMKDGSMFGSLGDYSQQAYWEEHPYVYITTDHSVLQYEIFSAYEAPVTSDTYRLYVEDDETKRTVLEFFITSSVLKSTLTPTIEDSILTLSTCTGTGTYHSRWVVQAALTHKWNR